VEKVSGRRGGERGTMERKVSESTQWRGRRSGERHGGDGGRDARRSAVAGPRHCSEFFLFIFLEEYGGWSLEVNG
jgi:hypothetical protein